MPTSARWFATVLFAASAAAFAAVHMPMVDGDADGVADEVDDCPYTEPGIQVDKSGCPKNSSDGDLDGVPDAQDDCPYTTPGARVDSKGCALDSDFDGVADGLDACPDTELGVRVDAKGCAAEQVASVAIKPAPADEPALSEAPVAASKNKKSKTRKSAEKAPVIAPPVEQGASAPVVAPEIVMPSSEAKVAAPPTKGKGRTKDKAKSKASMSATPAQSETQAARPEAKPAEPEAKPVAPAATTPADTPTKAEAPAAAPVVAPERIKPAPPAPVAEAVEPAPAPKPAAPSKTPSEDQSVVRPPAASDKIKAELPSKAFLAAKAAREAREAKAAAKEAAKAGAKPESPPPAAKPAKLEAEPVAPVVAPSAPAAPVVAPVAKPKKPKPAAPEIVVPEPKAPAPAPVAATPTPAPAPAAETASTPLKVEAKPQTGGVGALLSSLEEEGQEAKASGKTPEQLARAKGEAPELPGLALSYKGSGDAPTETSQQQLRALGNALNLLLAKNPRMQVSLRAYTGKSAAAKPLFERRLAAAKAVLLERGVPASRMRETLLPGGSGSVEIQAVP